jgi:hypothetical protein
MRAAILATEMIANGGAPREAVMLAQWLEALGHRATLYAMEHCPEFVFDRLMAQLE